MRRLDIMMTECHHHDVRTTVTLDDDVSAKLKAEIRRTGRSFKVVINDLLRIALNARRERRTTPFVVEGRSLGGRPGLDFDRISELVEHLEGPTHR